MNVAGLLYRALCIEPLNIQEGLFLYEKASTSELIFTAHEILKLKVPGNKVTWMIDRNVNITNVCISGCTFCNFHCSAKSKKAYITSFNQYADKIEEMKKLGGNQLLLQGGLHPDLGLDFYEDLFTRLKRNYPGIKLHALGPAEIVHLSKLNCLPYSEVLKHLIIAGLDSLPGAGAEILSDRVRKKLSKNKCSTLEWLNVMQAAHLLNLTTSATMMFGHIETRKERIAHLVSLRTVQSKKPKNSKGFIAFIPWPFQDMDTTLKNQFGVSCNVTDEEYIRTIAMSRIMLNNITHIQASWLTVGKEVAQLCLHSGADDLGSIMIEENVVSSAGASNKMDARLMQQAIVEAGFIPQKRDQQYEYLNN